MNDSKDQKAAAEHPLDCLVRGWQPIETAPRDGRRILAFDKGCAMGVIWFNAKEQMFEDVQCLIDDDGVVTHWMPLPEAPNKEVSEGEHGK